MHVTEALRNLVGDCKAIGKQGGRLSLQSRTSSVIFSMRTCSRDMMFPLLACAREGSWEYRIWTAPAHKKALHADVFEHNMESVMGIPFFGMYRLFGGGGESRTPVRERSTQGLYRFSLRTSFRLGSCPQTGVRQLSCRDLLACVPVGIDARQSDELAPWRRIGRRPLRRDGLCRQGARLLTQRRRSRNRCWQLLCCRF